MQLYVYLTSLSHFTVEQYAMVRTLLVHVSVILLLRILFLTVDQGRTSNKPRDKANGRRSEVCMNADKRYYQVFPHSEDMTDNRDRRLLSGH